jgi:hypothetical protein
MPRNQTPFAVLVLPDVRETALDCLTRTRGIARRLDRLSAHGDRDITVKPDLLNSPLERRIMHQTLSKDLQHDGTVGCDLQPSIGPTMDNSTNRLIVASSGDW